MRKAWMAVAMMTAAVTVSGCVVYVGDGDDKRFMDSRASDGFLVLDRDGDFNRLGGDINLRGRIGGDLSLVSGDVDADELMVGGDVSIAAGDVTYIGSVGGEASIAGGDVDFAADVGDELSIAAGDLTVSGDIRGEAAMAAGDMHLSASFRDGLSAQADHIVFDGSVDGELTLVAANRIKRSRSGDASHGLIEIGGEIADGGEICGRSVVFDASSRVSGSLAVWAEQEPVVEPGARVGNIQFTPRNGEECDDLIDR